MAAPTLLDLLDDPDVFQPWFDGESWAAWRVFLRAVYGLPMSPPERTLYRRCTNRRVPPTHPATQAWVLAGRRSGKSRIAALIAAYIAARDYSGILVPGEQAILPVLASDRTQARNLFGYVSGLFESVPVLRALRADVTKESVAAAAIIAIGTSATPPLRLQLGTDCVHRVEQKLALVVRELDAWRELSLSTAHVDDAAPSPRRAQEGRP